MFWKSTKKEPKDSKERPPPSPSSTSNALVRQDPRTKVRTAIAESETTNTTVQSATIYDNFRNKITHQTVRQTVTHLQTGGVSEISIRRTPTKEELAELLGAAGTAWTKHETFATEINGRSESSFVQEQRMKFNQAAAASACEENKATATPKFSGAATKSAANRPVATRATTKTDSFGLLSPLPALPPPKSASFGATLISSNTTPLGKLPMLPRSSVTSNVSNSSYTSSPLSKYSGTQNVDGNLSKSYSAGRITTANPSWRKVEQGAISCAAPKKTLFNDAKTTTAIAIPPPLPPSSTYVSPYANRIRGPLASSYSYAYGKPANAGSTTTTKCGTRALVDVNPIGSENLRQNIEAVNVPRLSPKLSAMSISSNLPGAQSKQAQAMTIVATNKSKLKPGYAVIFNSVDFNDKERFEKRDGSDYDAKLIRETLEQYKLKVEMVKNPTVKKIKDFVKTLTKKDYTNYSCLLIAILSHGSVYDSIAASDGEYNVDEAMLYPLLDVPSLKEKPKIFIIQACKGALVPGEYKLDASMARGSPSEILKCYSTFEGYVSYRTEKGSPFVQALCEEIKLKGQNVDIEQLMKNAIENVKIRTRSNQIPCMTTNLTKPFVFGNYV